MRELSARKDLDMLLAGLGIMGTGGGGDPTGWGRSVFSADEKVGRTYQLADPSEVPDDAFVLSGGYMGSIANESSLDRFVDGWSSDFELERAIRILEKEHGRSVDYLVPFELGGGNTPVVMSCASRLGIPTIDGDGVGRAAPETHMSSFLGHGVSLTPMPLVGSDGTSLIVRSGDTFLADEVGRSVVSRRCGFMANAHYGMSGADLKRSVIPHSITRALSLGTFVHELDARGEAAMDRIAEYVGGMPLLYGRVTSTTSQEERGFFRTIVEVSGIGRDAGHDVSLVVKNEVMCVKHEGQALVVFPDLVLLIDPETRAGMMSPELKVGREVLLVAVPCHDTLRAALRTPEGSAAFSSRRYGEDLEYGPVEELLKGWGV